MMMTVGHAQRTTMRDPRNPASHHGEGVEGGRIFETNWDREDFLGRLQQDPSLRMGFDPFIMPLPEVRLSYSFLFIP